MLRKFVFLFLIVSLLFPAFSQAQGLGNSPYSQIGVGDQIFPVSIQNLGAGGISVATYNREYLQLSNPAASVNKKGHYNDSLVKIEGAGTMQYKTLTQGQTKENTSGANFRYFAFTIPIGKVWNTTISMQPFAVKDLTYSQIAPVPNDPNQALKQFNYQGKGGIYQVAVNNGWGVGKSMSVGLGLEYLFGPATVTETSVLVNNQYAPVQSDVQHGFRERINHSGLGIKPAMHYRKEFYRWKDSVLVPTNVFWNAGATVQLFTPTLLSVNVYDVRQASSGTVSEDSLISGTSKTIQMPAQFTFGLSLDKPNRWMIGAEGSVADWRNFSYPEDLASYGSSYTVAWSAGLGGEFRPASRRQWKAATYRAGVNFSGLPYMVNGSQLTDFSASLGATLPVGVRGATGATFPKINVALVVGQRGTFSANSIQELYARVHFSILITDKWFIKRRIQ